MGNYEYRKKDFEHSKQDLPQKGYISVYEYKYMKKVAKKLSK